MTGRHTIVLSDIHLTEAEPADVARPLWKRYKAAELFVDESLARMLAWLDERVEGSAELVLNGDVFDFDAVTSVPEHFSTSWLERARGLAPEERKSAWKMRRILRDHPTWVRAVRGWLAAGHEVVFVVGNHDLELHWPAAQDALLEAVGVERGGAVRFCEWFTVSGGDTLVEHGNQYDRYCLCNNPVHPLVGPVERPRVRLPFGDLAGKLMLNGMGLFNPHVESSFIRGSLREYVLFFYRYVVRVQPFLVLVWAWSALATLVVSLREGFLPALTDPLGHVERIEDIAARARSRPGVVSALYELRVHPAIFNPWMIARELWLDRAVLLLLVLAASIQVWSLVNAFQRLSLAWVAVPLALLLPPFFFYAATVRSQVGRLVRALVRRAPVAAQIAGVERVVYGHTHVESHLWTEGVEVLNPGTWSSAYEDPECTVPFGRKCFVWLVPGEEGRIATLHEWRDPGTEVIAPVGAPEPPRLRDRLRDTLSGLPSPGRRR